MDNKKIKVLIGDDSAEYGITCANELRSLGLYVVTRRKDGKVILDAIRNDTPDVVVMDAVLPGMDAIEILEKSQTFETAPAFIITSSYENAFIERQVMEKGAAYFMLKPFHISTLGSRITDLAAKGMPNPKNSANRNSGFDRESGTAGKRDKAALSHSGNAVRHHVFPRGTCHSPRDRNRMGSGRSGYDQLVLRLYREQLQGQAHQFRIHCPADRQAAAAIRQKHRPSRLNQRTALYKACPTAQYSGILYIFVCYRKKFNFFLHFLLAVCHILWQNKKSMHLFRRAVCPQTACYYLMRKDLIL